MLALQICLPRRLSLEQIYHKQSALPQPKITSAGELHQIGRRYIRHLQATLLLKLASLKITVILVVTLSRR